MKKRALDSLEVLGMALLVYAVFAVLALLTLPRVLPDLP